MNIRSEDMVHQVAGGRRGVDALLEAEQVNVVCLEVLDRFEQINEETPETVQAGKAEAVAGGRMVDQLRQPRALEPLDGNHVLEDTDGTGLTQATLLGGVNVLVRGRQAGMAEDVSRAVCLSRLIAGSGTLMRGFMILPIRVSNVSLYSSPYSRQSRNW